MMPPHQETCPGLNRRDVLGATLGLGVAIHGFRQGAEAGATSAGPPTILTLEAAPLTKRLLPPPAGPAAMLGYSGVSPGPLLRLKRGEPATIQLINRLAEPTTLHIRGLRHDNTMDGVAGLTQPPLSPGSVGTVTLRPRDAGTSLYGPFVPGHTASQVERGLAGMLIVEEEDWPAPDADLPLLLDDWRVTAEGALDEGFLAVPDAARLGRLGNRLVVNGALAHEARRLPPGARVRLRIGGAMNARIIPILFDGHDRATVIALDGHPCEPFDPLRRQVVVAPGSRTDVVLDLPREAGRSVRVLAQLGDGLPLLDIVTEGEALPLRDAVPPLPGNLLPPAIRLQDARRAELLITGGFVPPADGSAAMADAAVITRSIANPARIWQLNGGFLAGLAGRPLISVRRDQVVVLALSNRTAWMQVLTVHGHAFRVLHALDDGWEPYFLDTVMVPAGRTVRIAFIADNPGRWAIRSAILEHMETGVLTYFEVHG